MMDTSTRALVIAILTAARHIGNVISEAHDIGSFSSIIENKPESIRLQAETIMAQAQGR